MNGAASNYFAYSASLRRICMRNISRTMECADVVPALQNAAGADSIVGRIVRKTGNRKLAAVLALDLFLVGVDTVSSYKFNE